MEVAGGRTTDPAVVDWTAGFYAALGKRPIRIRREVPGHVANLILVAAAQSFGRLGILR